MQRTRPATAPLQHAHGLVRHVRLGQHGENLDDELTAG